MKKLVNMDPRLVQQLILSRKALKHKYTSLKSDIARAQSQLERNLKPISEPLKKVLEKVVPIKTEPLIKGEWTRPPSPYSTPKKKPKEWSENLYNQYLPQSGMSFLEDTYSNIPEYSNIRDMTAVEDYDPDTAATDEENKLIDESIAEAHHQIQNLVNTPAYHEYIEDFHKLPRTYVDESIRGNEEEFDRHYGLAHDMQTDKFTLANTAVNIEGPDVIVNGIKYPGTVGLYELLFKKNPIGYSKDDLDQYMDILKRTNAYRRNFNPDAQIQGTQSEKYRTIIKPYLMKKNILKHPSTLIRSSSFKKPPPPTTRLKAKRGGRLDSSRNYNMVELSNKPIDYVYYDDPNELVDRLRLLMASDLAGNKGHNNEIISIIEELREAKIIK